MQYSNWHAACSTLNWLIRDPFWRQLNGTKSSACIGLARGSDCHASAPPAGAQAPGLLHQQRRRLHFTGDCRPLILIHLFIHFSSRPGRSSTINHFPSPAPPKSHPSPLHGRGNKVAPGGGRLFSLSMSHSIHGTTARRPAAVMFQLFIHHCPFHFPVPLPFVYPRLCRRSHRKHTHTQLQQWFITLLSENRAHYISDIYTGFRNKLHFTIAVKQIVDGQNVILRSTLDPDKFYLFLRTIHRGKGSESFIINNAGIHQVVDPARGQLFSDTKKSYPPRRSEHRRT